MLIDKEKNLMSAIDDFNIKEAELSLANLADASHFVISSRSLEKNFLDINEENIDFLNFLFKNETFLEKLDSVDNFLEFLLINMANYSNTSVIEKLVLSNKDKVKTYIEDNIKVQKDCSTVSKMLISACDSNNIEVVKYMLTNDFFKNYVNANTTTYFHDKTYVFPLLIASFHGFKELANFLLHSEELEIHSDITKISENFNQDSFTVACIRLNDQIVEVLYNYDKVSIKDNDEAYFEKVFLATLKETENRVYMSDYETVLNYLIFNTKLRFSDTIKNSIEENLNDSNTNPERKKLKEQLYKNFSIKEMNVRLTNDLTEKNIDGKIHLEHKVKL